MVDYGLIGVDCLDLLPPSVLWFVFRVRGGAHRFGGFWICVGRQIGSCLSSVFLSFLGICCTSFILLMNVCSCKKKTTC